MDVQTVFRYLNDVNGYKLTPALNFDIDTVKRWCPIFRERKTIPIPAYIYLEPSTNIIIINYENIINVNTETLFEHEAQTIEMMIEQTIDS